MGSHNLRGSALRFTLLVGSVAAALLCVEAAGRVYAYATHQGRGMTPDPVLGLRPLPHIEKRGGHIWGVSRVARTNSHGWRDRERSFNKPPGTRRIVVVGDSFTWGTGVDDGERFTDFLPDLMENVEAINLGVPAYGPDQALRVLERDGIRYDPDIVIFQVCVYNDLTDLTERTVDGWPKPLYTLDDNGLRLVSPPTHWTVRLREWSYATEFLYQRLWKQRSERQWPQPDAALENMPLFEAITQRMIEVTASHHMRLVVVLAYAPDGNGPDFSRVGQRIGMAFRSRSIPVLDTRELFASRSADPHKHLYLPTPETHWNVEGHRLVARGVQELLASVPHER